MSANIYYSHEEVYALINKAAATGVITDFPDLGVQILENQIEN